MKKSLPLTLAAAAVLSTGCASYRTTSNISSDATPVLPAGTKVLISEDGLQGRKFREVGPIEVSIKKLTAFHADPTRQQANEALSEKARVIGADAVINVTYKSGVGFTTWGYLDANGTGVKLAE